MLLVWFIDNHIFFFFFKKKGHLLGVNYNWKIVLLRESKAK